MDLINREQALGCFWNYANDDGTGYDETDMPAYDRLQALPIVAEVEDCISRQDAIDVLEERLRANGYSNVALVSELNRSIGYLMRLPSAQPQSTMGQANDTVQSTNDCISRQDAIDLLRKRLIETANNNVGIKCDAGEVFEDASERIRCWIDELPSAQIDMAENLYLYKCYITDNDGLQHEVIHTGDIRRVTGWEI